MFNRGIHSRRYLDEFCLMSIILTDLANALHWHHLTGFLKKQLPLLFHRIFFMCHVKCSLKPFLSSSTLRLWVNWYLLVYPQHINSSYLISALYVACKKSLEFLCHTESNFIPHLIYFAWICENIRFPMYV